MRKRGRPAVPVQERFWPKVDKTPEHGPWGDCWKWTASKVKGGYGQFGFQRKVMLAHRVSWELAYGKPPDDLWVLHRCDNPSCVNPSHLFLGTQQDNVRDMFEKGRQNRVKGIAHHLCKLTEIKVRAIRADPRSQHVIAADYNVSHPLIGKVKRREIWRHVK